MKESTSSLLLLLLEVGDASLSKSSTALSLMGGRGLGFDELSDTNAKSSNFSNQGDLVGSELVARIDSSAEVSGGGGQGGSNTLELIMQLTKSSQQEAAR